ncbi:MULTISPECIES: DUF885 family protein [unclassified Sphingomonas]|mgnify:CR=1 FL=1|uniref:DUF885 domain-containing protein n=1 Tax=unclassified Sphingomonas TaxID=196159 RepID=UPI000926829F|nr:MULTISPECIES: DUF885 family protein [unclassified Sphingomonas]MBN8849786.1 DUF885 family protein [Sphingomonas sp.]OJV31646.1 MAG: Tat pathway signal protein [Sphingomonas sp. 67-36]
MDRRTFLASSSAASALALVPGALRAQSAAGDAKLNATFDRVMARMLPEMPSLATVLGMDKGANAPLKHKLEDNSAAGRVRLQRMLKQAIADITAVPPATLSPGAKLDREVVLYSLNAQAIPQDRFGLDSVQRPYLIFQQGGSYFETPDFLNSSHTITNAEDCSAYLDRLAAMATSLDNDTAEQKAQAARGYVAPGWSLDLTLGQMAKLRDPSAAVNGLTQSLVTRAAKANIPGDWQAKASAIVEKQVYPALDRQIALIRELRAHGRTDDGLWAVPKGEEIYAAALAEATTTKFTPDEVHRMGLDQVASITAELDTILKANGLTQGSVADRLNALNVRPDQLYPDTDAGREQLIRDLNAGVAGMTAKLGQLVNNPPNAPLEIRRVPVEIQDGASNGYYYLAALDGSRPAIYWINLKSVGDWPKYSLPSLTYHEGVPGHHLQLTIAQQARTPLLRKLAFFNAYSEGWALYAEKLADEVGGYVTPLDRAGFLQSYLFRAARLVIDTGIHTQKWSREKATDYMVRTVGFAQPRSQREVERYCTQPGQACSYKVGHAAWVRAREKAMAIQGAKFNEKDFHDILHAGAMPLTILERMVEERARAAA